MPLHTKQTYSLSVADATPAYAPLTQDCNTDILIVGSGISGALAAWTLQRAGCSCIVIDKGAIGGGSTAASTSLLQYELDTPLRELRQHIGARRASAAYRLCYEALRQLEEVCAQAGAADLFDRRPSLQFASTQGDVAPLRDEYKLRRAQGFDIQWVEAGFLESAFGMKRPAGIVSAAGAQIDAYELTHRLHRQLLKMGGGIYAHTEAAEIDQKRSGVTVKTGDGHTIRARKLVMACGYESQRYIPRTVEELYRTYAIVSEPVDEALLWHQRSLIWETARPYHYLRTTPDNRIIIGGGDDRFDGKEGFPLLPQKARALERSFCELFPSIPFQTSLSWAGFFAGTPDGLPYIGGIADQPNTFYTLGFGGNGILFSVLAAEIICAQIKGERHPGSRIFSFDR